MGDRGAASSILSAISCLRRRSTSCTSGAGNCWLSYRLAQRHHRPVAVDIFTDTRDGLGAATRYPVRFVTVEAEFDSLPFPSASFDMAVFASSFHYSTDYARTLREVGRCLRPGAKSHDYRLPGLPSARPRRVDGCGASRLFREDLRIPVRHRRKQGISRPANGARAVERVGIERRVHRPWYGWQWHLRPWKAKLHGKRPPSNFWYSRRGVSAAMIILLHPRSTRPKNRRFPLAPLALGAVLGGHGRVRDCGRQC